MQAVLAESRLTDRQKALFAARYQPLLKSIQRKSKIISAFFWLTLIYSALAGTITGLFPALSVGQDVSSSVAYCMTAIGLSGPAALALFAMFQLPKLRGELQGAADSLEDTYWALLAADLPDWQTFIATVDGILKKHRQEIKEITAQIEAVPREEE